MAGEQFDRMWAAVLREIAPRRHVELLRRVELSTTEDGRNRMDRVFGTLATEAFPVLDPENVAATTGSGYDTAADQLDAGPGTFAPLASPTFTGTLTAPNVTVTTALTTVDLTTTGNATLGNGDGDTQILRGHVKHKSAAPSIAVGVALGTGGSVGAAVTFGSDQAGKITLTAGTTSLTTGVAATITFATARPDTNYAVSVNEASGNSANTVFASVGSTTTTTWQISFKVAPGSGVVYVFTYVVVEITN